MDKSKSIIIFGASDDSKRLIGELYSTVLCELIDIVAICDNDSRIHGNQINGIVIIPPSELVNYEYDKIIVTPIFYDDIKKQLLKLGIEKQKIEPYRQNYKDYFDKKSRKFGNCEVGKYSYFKPNTKLWNTIIGSFCHIGDNCIIGQLGHDPRLITTYPFRYHFSNEIADCSLDPTRDKKKSIKKTIIKNDVYMGEGVVVSAGVTIGNGAIIASKAFVTKDVDDYTIVGGVPAKIIKKRFDDSHINDLLNIKWWESDNSELLNMIDDFEGNLDNFINKYLNN